MSEKLELEARQGARAVAKRLLALAEEDLALRAALNRVARARAEMSAERKGSRGPGPLDQSDRLVALAESCDRLAEAVAEAITDSVLRHRQAQDN